MTLLNFDERALRVCMYKPFLLLLIKKGYYLTAAKGD